MNRYRSDALLAAVALLEAADRSRPDVDALLALLDDQEVRDTLRALLVLGTTELGCLSAGQLRAGALQGEELLPEPSEAPAARYRVVLRGVGRGRLVLGPDGHGRLVVGGKHGRVTLEEAG